MSSAATLSPFLNFAPHWLNVLSPRMTRRASPGQSVYFNSRSDHPRGRFGVLAAEALEPDDFDRGRVFRRLLSAPGARARYREDCDEERRGAPARHFYDYRRWPLL